MNYLCRPMMRLSFFTVIKLCVGLLTAVLLCAPVEGAAQTAETQRIYKIALLGDSFFTNPGLGKQQTLEARLKLMTRLKKAPLDIKNFSDTDQETVDATEKLKDVLTWRPDIVIVHLGNTDIANKVNKRYMFNNLSKILYNLTRYNVRVLFYGVERPANLYNLFDFNTELADRYAKEIDELYYDIALMYNVLYRPSLTRVFEKNPYYYMPDRVHPNNRGVERLVSRLLQDIALVVRNFDDPVMLHNLSTNSKQRVALLGETLFSMFSGYEDISFSYMLKKHISDVRGKDNIKIDNYSSVNLDAFSVAYDTKLTTRVIKSGAAAAIVQLGVNDIVDTGSKSVKTIAKDIGIITGTLKKNNVLPFLVGAKRLDYRGKSVSKSKQASFNMIYKFIGDKLEVPYVEDITSVVPGYSIGSKNKIPDKESMQTMVETIWRGLEPYIIQMEQADRVAFAEHMNAKAAASAR